MRSIGIIYLTLSGNTEHIARQLKEIDPSIKLIPIKILDKIPRFKWRQIVKYGARTIMNRPIKYECDVSVVDQVDSIIIGSPIWVGRIPSPVRDIISSIDLKDKKIAAYCTFDSDPADFKDQLYAFTDSALFSAFHAFKEPLDKESPQFKQALFSLLQALGSSE
jgi:flavodoxin